MGGGAEGGSRREGRGERGGGEVRDARRGLYSEGGGAVRVEVGGRKKILPLTPLLPSERRKNPLEPVRKD